MSARIGQRIAEIRGDAGLSQSALARAVGTSQSAISQIESGDRNPTFDMLRQLATALDMEVTYLVGADLEELTPEEQGLFRQFRTLPVEARKELLEFVAYLRHKHQAGLASKKK